MRLLMIVALLVSSNGLSEAGDAPPCAQEERAQQQVESERALVRTDAEVGAWSRRAARARHELERCRENLRAPSASELLRREVEAEAKAKREAKAREEARNEAWKQALTSDSQAMRVFLSAQACNSLMARRDAKKALREVQDRDGIQVFRGVLRRADEVDAKTKREAKAMRLSLLACEEKRVRHLVACVNQGRTDEICDEETLFRARLVDDPNVVAE